MFLIVVVVVFYVKLVFFGWFVDIGGCWLYVECKGLVGGFMVVFEVGLFQYIVYGIYGKVQDLIVVFVYVCIYDCVGLGWSDLVYGVWMYQVMVVDLYVFVVVDGWYGFFVLVGYLIGGLFVCLYVVIYFDQVVVIVLVDVMFEVYFYIFVVVQGCKDIVVQIDIGLSKVKGDLLIVLFLVGMLVEVMMVFILFILWIVKEEYLVIDWVFVVRCVLGGYGCFGDMLLVVIWCGKMVNLFSEEDLCWCCLQEGLVGFFFNSCMIVVMQFGYVVFYEVFDVVVDVVWQVIDRLWFLCEVCDGMLFNYVL